MFIVSTKLDCAANTSKQKSKAVTGEKDKTLISPEDQFPVRLNDQVELEWFNFTETNEFFVPDLNEDVEATVEILQDSFNEELVVEDSNGGVVFALQDGDCEDYADDEQSDVAFDPANYVDDGWAAGVDDYCSGDDSGVESDKQSNDDVKEACNRYEKNSGSFLFSRDGKKIVLKCGQLYKDIDEFRKVVKAIAIQNGFRLQGIKNEKSRVTLNCAATDMPALIGTKGTSKSSLSSQSTRVRNNDNREANSNWIAVTFLHLVKANNQITIDIIAAELFKQYGIKCGNTRLYRAKNKALELLGEDHKASYNKLFRYMHAILNSNPGSTVTIDRDWLGGG